MFIVLAADGTATTSSGDARSLQQLCSRYFLVRHSFFSTVCWQIDSSCMHLQCMSLVLVHCLSHIQLSVMNVTHCQHQLTWYQFCLTAV